MHQEHPDIRVATLGDASEPSLQAAGMFPGRKTEITCKVTPGGETVYIPYESDKCSSAQDTNTWNGLKASEDVITLSQGGELIFYGLDPGFKLGYPGTRIFKDRPES